MNNLPDSLMGNSDIPFFPNPLGHPAQRPAVMVFLVTFAQRRIVADGEEFFNLFISEFGRWFEWCDAVDALLPVESYPLINTVFGLAQGAGNLFDGSFSMR